MHTVFPIFSGIPKFQVPHKFRSIVRGSEIWVAVLRITTTDSSTKETVKYKPNVRTLDSDTC
jgi:hypothetical protein